jgi:hypothetical protein
MKLKKFRRHRRHLAAREEECAIVALFSRKKAQK